MQENETLKLLLGRVRWSPEVFARKLNALAREFGRDDSLDIKTPYKWLRGRHPRPPWPDLTAALLTRELDERIRPGDLGWRGDDAILFVPASTGLAASWTVVGTLDAASEVSEANPMDRRSFLLLGGAVLTAPAHEWLIARPIADASQESGRTTVTPDIADHLDDVAAHLRQMDDRLGGGTMVEVVRSQANHVNRLLRDGRYSDSVGRQLHRTMGELLRLGGWVSFDNARHADAQRFLIAALHAAHTAGDRELGANVLGFMSEQAKDLRKYDEATKLGDTAVAGYQGSSPRVTAIVHMRAAQAYSHISDATETRRSIEAAYSAFRDTAPSQGEPGWCYWFDEAMLNEMIGYSHLKLGDWGRAASHLRTALKLQGDEKVRERALRLTLLADTHALEGDPERACDAGNRAIDTLATQVDSDRCITYVKTLQDHLTPYHRVPAVKELKERVDQLTGAQA